jgi:DNA-binding transcriptional MocR family regulator
LKAINIQDEKKKFLANKNGSEFQRLGFGYISEEETASKARKALKAQI